MCKFIIKQLALKSMFQLLNLFMAAFKQLKTIVLSWVIDKACFGVIYNNYVMFWKCNAKMFWSLSSILVLDIKKFAIQMLSIDWLLFDMSLCMMCIFLEMKGHSSYF